MNIVALCLMVPVLAKLAVDVYPDMPPLRHPVWVTLPPVHALADEPPDGSDFAQGRQIYPSSAGGSAADATRPATGIIMRQEQPPEQPTTFVLAGIAA